jgi:hypothetical protein
VAFTGRYLQKWEDDLKRLGLYGANFDSFWRPVEEFILESDFLVGNPILDGSGANGFLTEEGAPDLPKLVIYLKGDLASERIVFLGLDSASLPTDFPPEDWV